MVRSLALCVITLGFISMSLAQQPKPNYDETKIEPYTLPELLVDAKGNKVTTKEQWKDKRRAEVFKLFQKHVYGKTPDAPIIMNWRTVSEKPFLKDGIAICRQVELTFRTGRGTLTSDLMLVMPAKATGPVPVFVSLNFDGNHSTHADPQIILNPRWMTAGKGITNNKATEETRGKQASRWSYDKIIAEGFAVATAYYGDFEPDHPEGWKNGIRSILSEQKGTGKVTSFEKGDWGAIGAWSMLLQQMHLYIAQEPKLDAEKCIVLGHSRLGKTALWAGAMYERFAIVISNNSGEGGAALSRRNFGETVADLNKRFPHWFCGQYKEYSDKVASLPVDHHMLVALAAPRPIYIASASEDLWADPKGEFLAGVHAEPVFTLFSKKGLGQTEPPALDKSIGDSIGYHNRTGKHDVTEFDWVQYIAFAKRHFGK